MRRLLVGIVPFLLSFPASRAQAPPPTQAQLQAPAQDPQAQTPPAQASPSGSPQTTQSLVGSPVFVIYPANPPQRATILLNTVTGETWLLGVNGPDGQFQWTRIAVGDPSETAAPPR